MTVEVRTSLWIDRARQTLETSRFLLDQERGGTGAADRLFFAVFYAIRAVLADRLKIDVHAIKTHDGTEYFFYRDVVTPGMLDRSAAKIIHDVRELHREAEWGTEPVPRDAVERLFPPAKRFIDVCERLVNESREP